MGCLALNISSEKSKLKLVYASGDKALAKNPKTVLRVLGKDEGAEKSRIDYYPFGMLMPGRQYNSGEYRYGFNAGSENDNEIAGVGNSSTAKYWQYDTRLGRRWNVDPVTYPWHGGYTSFNNNPIFFIDPLGLFGTKKEAQAYAKEEGIRTGLFSRNKIEKNSNGEWMINNRKENSSIFNDYQFGIQKGALAVDSRKRSSSDKKSWWNWNFKGDSPFRPAGKYPGDRKTRRMTWFENLITKRQTMENSDEINDALGDFAGHGTSRHTTTAYETDNPDNNSPVLKRGTSDRVKKSVEINKTTALDNKRQQEMDEIISQFNQSSEQNKKFTFKCSGCPDYIFGANTPQNDTNTNRYDTSFHKVWHKGKITITNVEE